MKKSIFFLLTLLSFVGKASATDVLKVDDVTIVQGDQTTASVNFKFDQAGLYAGYQFVLTLPAGISVVTGSDGGMLVTPGSGQNTSMMFSSNYADGAWNVACFSFGSTLVGTQNELFSMTLQADASLTAGQILTATLTGIRLSTADNRSVKLADTSFDITVAQPADNRIVLDELSSTLPEQALNAKVRVLRTIKGGEWNTIVLPFRMTARQRKEVFGDDVVLADFMDYDVVRKGDEVTDIALHFRTITGILLANHPYLIKVKDDMTEFTLDDVDLEPAELPVLERGTSSVRKNFVGSYKNETLIPEDGLFISDGQFWYSAGKTKMKGYRAYFDFADVVTSGDESRVSMYFDNEQSTGIVTATTPVEDGTIYNLQGQRIVQPSKGVFIKGSKKVVRK